MRFCHHCGGPLLRQVPAGDDRPRHVCQNCGAIIYSNPRNVCGCLPIYQGKVLLCRRAIEPRRGYWTLPAGFMENGETTAMAAERETLEEACARVNLQGLYILFDLPHISQVYIFFLAELLDRQFSAGAESLEVALFEESDIPWDELAFPTIGKTLTYYFDDRRRGSFPVRSETIAPLQ